jgi:HTH-type transcriptional regulator/antitoxin HigA
MNKEEYELIMDKVEDLLVQATQIGGFESLSQEDKTTLSKLSRLAESYEDNIPMMPLKNPKTLEEILRFKMYEKGWRQKQLAAALEISEATISGLLSGKRKLSMDLAKKMHLQLGIDAQFLLRLG